MFNMDSMASQIQGDEHDSSDIAGRQQVTHGVFMNLETSWKTIDFKILNISMIILNQFKTNLKINLF